jgi:hypothetical protein
MSLIFLDSSVEEFGYLYTTFGAKVDLGSNLTRVHLPELPERSYMISQCMNPECRKELRYLRSGRVIRTTHRNGAQVQVEHFWLCGECHLDYDFLFAKDGRVSLTRRPNFVASAKPALDLLLVS